MTEACSSCSSSSGIAPHPILATPPKPKPEDLAQDGAQAIRKTDVVQFSSEAQRLLELEKMYGA